MQLALQLISPPARPASVPLARCLGGVAEDAEACDLGAHGRSGRPGPPFPFPIIVTVSFSSGLLLSSLLRTLSSSPQHHQHHQLVPPAPSLQHQNMTTSLILSVTIILQIPIMRIIVAYSLLMTIPSSLVLPRLSSAFFLVCPSYSLHRPEDSILGAGDGKHRSCSFSQRRCPAGAPDSIDEATGSLSYLASLYTRSPESNPDIWG